MRERMTWFGLPATPIPHRGNRGLKRALFHIPAPLVWFDKGSNPDKDLFQRKMAEGREWYQARPFVCAALASHIYHCLKFNDPYDVERAFEASSFNPASAEESLGLAVTRDETFEVMETSLDETEG